MGLDQVEDMGVMQEEVVGVMVVEVDRNVRPMNADQNRMYNST